MTYVPGTHPTTASDGLQPASVLPGLSTMMTAGFRYETHPQRVVFGAGKIGTLATEIAALGAKRALVVSTPGQRTAAEDIARRLGDLAAGTCAEALMHTPVEATERAMTTLAKTHADCLVSYVVGKWFVF